MYDFAPFSLRVAIESNTNFFRINLPHRRNFYQNILIGFESLVSTFAASVDSERIYFLFMLIFASIIGLFSPCVRFICLKIVIQLLLFIYLNNNNNGYHLLYLFELNRGLAIYIRSNFVYRQQSLDI